ncbi:NAD(P)/FAD-dependent oxidoreductase [Cryptosporangium phraense]|uniref:NAD(P)/FAD-dependent oxidoreductase n=1 Tax=Cryptosporangium phraense TaxID=2593070 RepID=A0A545AGT7_9ACTN|nr:NAD(P)/FAD-dependent oxidoreductase [Cryptosporangium phraense]TQS40524.1 NAD(P)/FAD-dependent oxidoreductase [Cryptosporangium phraense]
MSADRPHILVVGGGYVGLYTALELQRRAKKARITVVDPQPHMTYQPFLPEAAAGNLEPRHVVAPLRKTLRGAHVITGYVESVDNARRTATIVPVMGDPYELTYDHIVLAPGSVSRTLPIPGLKENAVGFKTVGEAIYLRNQVLGELDAADSTDDPALRQAATTFVFVGGGYAGIEALAELEDMVRSAVKYYGTISQSDIRFVLVEASQRILPEVGPEMGAYTVQRLLDRGIDIRLNTRLESCVDGHVKLSDGDEFEARTIVWTAGVKAHPMLANTDLPLDERGRVTCLPTLQVVDPEGNVVEGAWSAGDCAAVPDLTSDTPGATCSPSAQHAVRQAKRLGKNIAILLNGGQPVNYEHKHVGSVASLGLYKGVAQTYGVKTKGFVAWMMHRAYHVSRVPTFNRKVRVISDWTLALFLRREVVALGQLHDPRASFELFATPSSPDPKTVVEAVATAGGPTPPAKPAVPSDTPAEAEKAPVVPARS